MVAVEKALKIILKNIATSKTEKIPILDSLERVISCDVKSMFDIPRHDNSAMDGYAMRSLDTKGSKNNMPAVLKLIGESRAGRPYQGRITKNTAVRIMTGAVMPDGADCVVKIEDSNEKDGYVYLNNPVKKSQYVRFAREDVKKGGVVLKKGKRLTPADIGMLASLKQKDVRVYKKPAVAILCSGDELIEINESYKKGKVISSNLYSLSAQIIEAGGIPISLGIKKDDKKTLMRSLKKGLKYDFLLTSGGISVGEYDFIKEALEKLGAKNKIYKVSMRPGKPFSFFLKDNSKIFALPGNPVSCMVAFEVFVRPSLRKASGHSDIFRKKIDALLEKEIQKNKGQKFFIRGIITKRDDGYHVRPTGPQGSGILSSMSLANGLIVADEREEKIKKGAIVKVIVLDDGIDYSKNF